MVEIWETRNSLIALQIRMKKSLLKEIFIALQIKKSLRQVFKRNPGSEIQSRQVLFRPLWVDGEGTTKDLCGFLFQQYQQHGQHHQYQQQPFWMENMTHEGFSSKKFPHTSLNFVHIGKKAC